MRAKADSRQERLPKSQVRQVQIIQLHPKGCFFRCTESHFCSLQTKVDKNSIITKILFLHISQSGQ